MSRAAAFLDRDGTIIEDASYIRDPADVVLMPGSTDAIRRLNDAGVPVVVVTNQSGIARGLLSVDDYEAVRSRVDELLRSLGARIDASYMCPHYPDISGVCECRKPGLLLYRRAAVDHDLDLARSAFIGDRWRDAAPASAFGALGVVILSPSTPDEDVVRADADGLVTVRSLDDAVTRLLVTLPAPAVRP